MDIVIWKPFTFMTTFLISLFCMYNIRISNFINHPSEKTAAQWQLLVYFNTFSPKQMALIIWLSLKLLFVKEWYNSVTFFNVILLYFTLFYFITMLFQFLVKVKKKSMFTKTLFQIMTVYSRDSVELHKTGTRSTCTKLGFNQSFAYWMQSQFLSKSTIPLPSRSAEQSLCGSAFSAWRNRSAAQPFVESSICSIRPRT